MSKMKYFGRYLVRWTDSNGKKHKKEYDDWETAQKALRWLGKSNVRQADIAIPYEDVRMTDEGQTD
jgi:hypothetical protein